MKKSNDDEISKEEVNECINTIEDTMDFLFGKEQAVFAHHNAAHFIARIPPAFKLHPPAAVREIQIPGYIIINTLVAVSQHQVRFRNVDCRFRILNVRPS